MLEQAGMANDDPYWSANTVPTLKQKCTAAEDELLNDSVSVVKKWLPAKRKRFHSQL